MDEPLLCVDWLEGPDNEVALVEDAEVPLDEETLGELEDEGELVDEAGKTGEVEELLVLLIEEVIVLFIENVTELRNTPLYEEEDDWHWLIVKQHGIVLEGVGDKTPL